MPQNTVQGIANKAAARSARRLKPTALAPHLRSREASLQIVAARRESTRLTKLDALISEISRSLLSTTSKDLDASLRHSLASIGQAFGAHRVLFYVGQDMRDVLAEAETPARRVNKRFEPCRLWTSEAGVQSSLEPEPTLDLDSFIDRDRFLVSGYASHGPAACVANEGMRSGWNSIRTPLYVPCATEKYLFGLFVIESGLALSRWSAPLVDRAECVGRLFAGAFERSRLTRKLGDEECRQGHGARLETLGRVASAVAHDFNNVLTAILGYADLLDLELEEGGGRSELGEIRTAANRAAGLVEQVLTFGRTQQTGVEAIDLAETIEGLRGMLRQVVGSEIDVRFDWESRDEETRVRLDPGRLGPVIMNLASNARGALADQTAPGVFSLSTRRVSIRDAGRDAEPETATCVAVGELQTGAYMRLSAEDNGCGLDAALVERIFEPFFTTKGSRDGTGLGLASMAEFVEQAGGAIRVESAPGHGAAFHLYFPIEA